MEIVAEFVLKYSFLAAIILFFISVILCFAVMGAKHSWMEAEALLDVQRAKYRFLFHITGDNQRLKIADLALLSTQDINELNDQLAVFFLEKFVKGNCQSIGELFNDIKRFDGNKQEAISCHLRASINDAGRELIWAEFLARSVGSVLDIVSWQDQKLHNEGRQYLASQVHEWSEDRRNLLITEFNRLADVLIEHNPNKSLVLKAEKYSILSRL